MLRPSSSWVGEARPLVLASLEDALSTSSATSGLAPLIIVPTIVSGSGVQMSSSSALSRNASESGSNWWKGDHFSYGSGSTRTAGEAYA